MIKHIWTVVCRETKIDEASNNISIIDAYENLQFSIDTEDPGYKKGLPIGVPFNFEVVSLFFRDKKGDVAELEETVLALDPKGKRLGEFQSKIQFKDEHDRIRNLMKLDTIVLTRSGTYLFQVFTKRSDESGKKEQITVIPVNITVSVNGEEL
jgi:hypothetical protein